METRLLEKPRPYSRVEWLQLCLFWSWNLIFLAFMSLGFAPLLLPDLFTAARVGTIPVMFLLYGLILACIPAVAVILGLTTLRRSPSGLYALGYVIEGPLMLMLAVRFFVIRQATAATALLMIMALLGMATFLWTLLDRRRGGRSAFWEILRLAGLTLMALVCLYASAWIAFYAIPMAVAAARGLAEIITNLPRVLQDVTRDLIFLLSEALIRLPFTILGFMLLVYTATLFILTPLAVPFLSLRAWLRSLLALARRSGWTRPAMTAGAVFLLSAALFFLANQQPQKHSFSLLEKPPASPEQARRLLEDSDAIRAGLLNAYLAPFRYISAQGEVVHVTDIYAAAFHMQRERAYQIQRLYEALASPLLYQPVEPPNPSSPVDNQALREEPQRAARLYQRFFDTPITVAERQEIVRAARSTWSSDQAEAAWQAVDDREVHLLRQELSLLEHGDWAEVELHETYQNQTGELQEVVYYFNLPESAVLTGVWLGYTPDKESAFTFQVAPRGAAQAVYREQTRLIKDPALLEQIGPRQYRLRVYPIPNLTMRYDESQNRTVVSEAPELHMWLAWQQMADGGAWNMPQIAVLRNVFWDDNSVRLVNGQTWKAQGDEWLPRSLPAAESLKAAHRVDFPGGMSVVATPAEQVEAPALPAGTRLAVVLDRSRSMESVAEQVVETMEALKANPLLASPVDVYLTSSPYRGEEPSLVTLKGLDPQKIIYFGGQNAAELLAQFEAIHQSQGEAKRYDAILMITDGSGYELGPTEARAPLPSCPLWVLHLGGKLPLGYDDQTLEAIQASGGGVATALPEALARLAMGMKYRENEEEAEILSSYDMVDGYVWSVLPTSEIETAQPSSIHVLLHAPSEPFAALAARRLILAEMQRSRGQIQQVETLDRLHALAVNYQIVTPYSSMIVLVSGEQQQLLDKLSKLDDRFQREVEAIGETTPSAPIPLTGVPEPHEYLLLGIAAALLVYLALSRRRAAMPFGLRFK